MLTCTLNFFLRVSLSHAKVCLFRVSFEEVPGFGHQLHHTLAKKPIATCHSKLRPRLCSGHLASTKIVQDPNVFLCPSAKNTLNAILVTEGVHCSCTIRWYLDDDDDDAGCDEDVGVVLYPVLQLVVATLQQKPQNFPSSCGPTRLGTCFRYSRPRFKHKDPNFLRRFSSEITRIQIYPRPQQRVRPYININWGAN